MREVGWWTLAHQRYRDPFEKQVPETTMHKREAMTVLLLLWNAIHVAGPFIEAKSWGGAAWMHISTKKVLLRSQEFSVLDEGAKFYFSSFLGKTVLPMLCLFKLVHPRRSPKLLSSSWRAFNLLGKQWSQIFFNVALILLGKHLFTLGLTGSKWEVCMCPLTLQLTECEILGPQLLWTL